MTGAGPGLHRLDSLARSITRRLRRGAALRAIAGATVFAATTLAVLELAARVVPFPALRTVETGVVALAAAAACMAAWRARPARSDWRAVADGFAAEPGVFSAAGSDAGETALSMLVRARAEDAAVRLLAEPPARGRFSLRARQAILATLAAVAIAALPGRLRPPGELDSGIQAKLLSGIRSLPDAAAAADLARTQADLEGRRFTAQDARRLAGSLARSGRERDAKDRALADTLASATLLRALADAIRARDGAALDRALADLAERARRAEPRSPESLDAASRLLAAAAVERDPTLKQALADAGEAFAGGGFGLSERLEGLGPPLRRQAAASDAIRDFVVTLEAAAGDAGGAGPAPVPSPATSASGAPPVLGAGPEGSLPLPGDYRALVRPGSADEAVLRRYFAIP